jgi:hypothetical protein
VFVEGFGITPWSSIQKVIVTFHVYTYVCVCVAETGIVSVVRELVKTIVVTCMYEV